MKRTSLLILIFLLATLGSAAGEPEFVILCGSGGEAEYTSRFHEWGTRLRNALRELLGHDPSRIELLAEAGGKDGSKPISLQAVRDLFARITAESKLDDDLYVILIGHGSYLKKEAKFLIPGPDLSASDLKDMLTRVQSRRVVVIDSTSASAAFVNELSAPNRVIVSATKSIGERNATTFMEFFIQAIEEGSADLNRDERISVLEACKQADSLTQAWYLGERLIPSEHAILDDNGDGLGTRLSEMGSDDASFREGNDASHSSPVPDGLLAATCFLKDYRFPPNVPKSLVERYLDLLNKIEDLKRDKAKLPPEEYDSKLEALFIEAAQANREIRRMSKDETAGPKVDPARPQ